MTETFESINKINRGKKIKENKEITKRRGDENTSLPEFLLTLGNSTQHCRSGTHFIKCLCQTLLKQFLSPKKYVFLMLDKAYGKIIRQSFMSCVEIYF